MCRCLVFNWNCWTKQFDLIACEKSAILTSLFEGILGIKHKDYICTVTSAKDLVFTRKLGGKMLSCNFKITTSSYGYCVVITR